MTPVGRVLKAFPSLLRIGFAEMVAYRAEVVIWILTASMPLLMLAVFDRVADDGPVSGMDRADFAGYFVAVLVVRQLTSAWVVWELNHQIRAGTLSPSLLKPVHPLAWLGASTLATIPFRLVVLVPLVFLLWLWRPEMHFQTELWVLPLIALSLLLAAALNFAIQVAFASLAFWLGQSIGIFAVWFAFWTVFSGYAVPVSILPGWIADVAGALPFHAQLGATVELVTGQVAGAGLASTLALQAGWLTAFVFLAALLWRRGIRRYEAYGA